MNLSRSTALLSIPVLSLLCAANAGATGAADAVAAKDIAATLHRYTAAVKAGPVDAIVACYTEDADLLQPGMAPLHGRQAIHDFLAPLATQFAVESAEMASDSLQVFGDSAFQWGTYRQAAGPVGAKPGHYEGRFAAQWQRDVDGTWRMRRLMVQPVQSQAQ